MSDSDSVTNDFLSIANPADVPELAAIARAELPSMTALHDEQGWQTYNRFGAGSQLWGNCTLILRHGGEDGPASGFIWADSAMHTDSGIEEPWWCINAVAIAPHCRGAGRGTALVSRVTSAARTAGVQLLYGQSVPAAVPFWKKLGFILAGEAEPIRTHSPARRTVGGPVMLTAEPGAGDRWFVKYLATAPGSVSSGLLPVSMLPPL
ncbi:GNAT family N-acetyltransferase [Herbiconiux sp. VKM Ac-2851]|nr:GNAT family N-acetyltransferase [Herbiconiux sp. VKM Ac-2851]